LRRFGVDVEREDWASFSIPANARYRSPGTVYVEGDARPALFPRRRRDQRMSGGGPVRVVGVGRNSIQGDVLFAEVLERMGGRITMGDNWIEDPAGAAARRKDDSSRWTWISITFPTPR